MRQLEPRFGKRELEFLRVLEKTLGNLAVAGVKFQRQIGREHHGRVTDAVEVRIRDGTRGSAILWLPLHCARRAAGLLPVVSKQVRQIHYRPLGWRRRPGALETRGHCVLSISFTATILPSHALLNDGLASRFWPDTIIRLVGTVCFAKGVPACNQRNRLLVIHRHTPKSFANIVRGENRVGVAIRTLWVHVDETHLHRSQPFTELASFGIALISQHFCLWTPVNPLRLPVISATAGKTKCLEAHIFHGHIPGKYHQISPGDLVAVLLLDGPKQPSGLVQVAVIGPAVQRFKPLLTTVCASTAVGSPIGTRAVPSHTNKERSVVTIVSRPPGLRCGQRVIDIRFQRLEIQSSKLRGVIKISAQGIVTALVLAQRRQIEAGRPPGLSAFWRAARH